MLGQSGEISISGERDVCVIQPIFTLSAVMNLTAASIGKLIIAVSIPLSALLILFYGTLPNIAKIELLIHFIFGSIFLLPFLHYPFSGCFHWWRGLFLLLIFLESQQRTGIVPISFDRTLAFVSHVIVPLDDWWSFCSSDILSENLLSFIKAWMFW